MHVRLLQEAVDIFGLSALDRLFCFMIVRELQNFLKYLQRSLMKTESFFKQLKSFVKLVEDPNAIIRKFISAPPSLVLLHLELCAIIHFCF